MKTTNDENKIWFEQNFLDGDKIQDGQTLSSEFCFEAVMEMREKTIYECIACVPLTGINYCECSYCECHDDCREQTITNLNNLKNNEQ